MINMENNQKINYSLWIYPGLMITDKLNYHSPEDIIQFVCDQFNVPFELLLTKTKGDMPIPIVRHVCNYMVHMFTPLSTNKIGKLFNRTHATVLHSLKCVNNMKQFKDKDFYFIIQKIENELLEKHNIYERIRN